MTSDERLPDRPPFEWRDGIAVLIAVVWATLYVYAAWKRRPYPAEVVPVALIAVTYLLGARVFRGIRIVREEGREEEREDRERERAAGTN